MVHTDERKNMTKVRFLVIGLMIALTMWAARPHGGVPGQFDYYVLSLSWAPDFCAQAGGKKTANECGTGRHIAFVVHGLWPQFNTKIGPENCGPASPVSESIVKLTLNYIPTASLIQHEWGTHGTCSGLNANDFFAQVRKARDSVQIPTQLSSLAQKTQASATQIEGEFAAANPTFPATAFRATCTSGMLQEVRVCLDKNLAPRACTSSAGECAMPSMKILPPR
jgi:ribonuclease T2